MIKASVIGAALVLALTAGLANAKIPAPVMDDAAKAKAAEAKVKADEGAKKEAEQLAKAQDKVADRYKKGKGKPAGKQVASAPAAKNK
jgi:hypothetical protein